MKRRDLIRAAQKLARQHGHEFEFDREGGGHSVYQVAGRNVTIPRHREINEHTAKEILKQIRRAIEGEG